MIEIMFVIGVLIYVTGAALTLLLSDRVVMSLLWPIFVTGMLILLILAKILDWFA